MKQKAEITFEVEETIVLKQGGKMSSEHCPQCSATTHMLSPDVLSLVTGMSERDIFRLVEIGAVHFVENGRLLACPGCLKRLMLGGQDTAIEKRV